MEITKDIKYVGVDDRKVDLFEGQYPVPNGISYNSYVIMDKKIAVMDTVDQNFTKEWLDNIASVLEGRRPDYLVVQHMEPDHSANIQKFMETYPEAVLVGNKKTFAMIDAFFDLASSVQRLEVAEGDVLDLGEHKLNFVFAPMVHWPEVMVTYDSRDKVLFSADGFGKFGVPGASEPWDDESRRYFIGIVGKYGAQVQALLKKAAGLDIAMICPLHGPVLKEDLGHYLSLYDTWSSYAVEDDGIVIAYTSVYGHTKKAVELLSEKLRQKGCPKVVVHDLARTDVSYAVADAFRYGKLVLATTTYNADIFPFMRNFIEHLTERNFQNRTVGLIENGSWAPMAAKVMKGMLENSKNIKWLDTTVHIKSAMKQDTEEAIEKMADELCMDYIARSDDKADKHDMKALFKIGYGLYVVTSNDGVRDNGFIVNAVNQLTDNPYRVSVTINKANYSHDVIKKTGIMNLNCLSVDAPFSVFKNFGFQSGRDVDKFRDIRPFRTDNGLAFLPEYINAVMSLKVEQYVDLGTHGMFICTVEEARVISDTETMTYTFYQNYVKPRPETEGKKGFVCKVCGYVYEGDELPDDFICPLCKHGAADFEPIG
ncbi:MAG TPA: flavin reductase [Candidatus Avilachnospira avicola]|nr:flavin reductase [Candidatus Avilachnospira avicola]